MSELVDPFGRHINYARLSVTDRCDFRCVYCMAEEMTFLPRQSVLSLEELYSVASGLVAAGIRKIRLTGGEPLIRSNVMSLITALGKLDGLEELTLTTNGSQLTRLAGPLREAGVARINISLDSLDADKFKRITRTGDLANVLAGIDAAIEANFDAIKINSVILKHRNDDEIIDLLDYALGKGIDISFIEEMPLGQIVEHDRELAFCSSDEVRQTIEQHYQLQHCDSKTNGPSRYYQIKHPVQHPAQQELANSSTKSFASKVGFISPHSHNFCGDCNRIRVTVEGRVLFCLGNEHGFELMPLLRPEGQAATEQDPQALSDKVARAVAEQLHLKPEKHHFDLSAKPDIVRFMNMTGG